MRPKLTAATIALLMTCLGVTGQEFSSAKTLEVFYDYDWKVTNNQLARYYSISTKTDSGWFRRDYFITNRKVQMLGLYEDKESTIKNGHFVFGYAGGGVKSTGQYSHGKKNGLFLSYYEDGSLQDSVFYENDKQVGTGAGWYPNGNQQYQKVYDANGNGSYTAWFDDGQPAAAGRYSLYAHAGRWNYFHKNGKISAIELYDAGKLTAAQYFDEAGSPADTSLHDQDAQFSGKKSWGKFVSENLYFPSHLDLHNTYSASLILEITIDEDGKVANVSVPLPLHPDFDAIAVKAVKKSPVWIPAVNHNRRVRYTFSQVVTFGRSYVEY